MAEDREKASGKVSARYIWDPEKLAWVDTGKTSPEEATSQIVEPEESVAEESFAEESFAEETLPEAGTVEAAVEVGPLEYKGVFIRLGGALVDLIILTIVGVILNYTIGRAIGGFPNYVLPIYGLLYFIGLWWWRGQTPGMMLIRAKVVGADGRAISVGRAFVRYVFYLMPVNGPITFFAGVYLGAWAIIVLPLVAVAVMGFSREKRGIHDLIAGTFVVDSHSAVVYQPEEVGTVEGEPPDESGPHTLGQG
jgi:uncharacterized RDD family membrane protein YckC